MSKRVLAQLEPSIVWSIFEEITKIPRPSKKEEKIRKWVKAWVKENNIEIKNEDETGNILLYKTPKKECEAYPILILQAHMDMVCQKEAGYEIDFENDPLVLVVDRDQLKAKGTSLGADNGIGMAIALAALVDPSLKNGPLEVVLTVDEETGLTGARNMQPNFFRGKYLLNLDSESIGKITISSAGGGDTHFELTYNLEETPNASGLGITISGLKGGHSGVDIDLPRLNAIKVGVDGLLALKEFQPKISSIKGGSAHNAIPREFSVEFLINKELIPNAKRKLALWKDATLKIAEKTEKNISINISELKIEKGISIQQSENITELIANIIHGPISFSVEIPGLVQTSNNLAQVKMYDNIIDIEVSTRSSLDIELEETRKELKMLGERFGFKINQTKAYPGWMPEPNSPFIKLVQEKYEEILNSTVELEAIHAGLECGLFKSLDPELQIVSIGPNIKNAHSPDEYIEINSLMPIWQLTRKVIENVRILIKK